MSEFFEHHLLVLCLKTRRSKSSSVSRQAARYLAAIIFIWSCRTGTRNQVAWPSVALSSTSHSHSISKWVIITAHLKTEALHAVFSIVDSNVFWNKCKNTAFQKRSSQTEACISVPRRLPKANISGPNPGKSPKLWGDADVTGPHFYYFTGPAPRNG